MALAGLRKCDVVGCGRVFERNESKGVFKNGILDDIMNDNPDATMPWMDDFKMEEVHLNETEVRRKFKRLDICPNCMEYIMRYIYGPDDSGKADRS